MGDWLAKAVEKQQVVCRKKGQGALATCFWEYQQRTPLEAEGQTQNSLLIAVTTGCTDRMEHWMGP